MILNSLFYYAYLWDPSIITVTSMHLAYIWHHIQDFSSERFYQIDSHNEHSQRQGCEF